MLVERSFWSTEEDPQSPYEYVTEVQWGEADYNFDLTRVYRHTETGELFYAEDSGCSCPSPFEDTTEEDLHRIERMQDWYAHVTYRTENLYKDHAATTDQVIYSTRVVSDHLNGLRSAE